MAAFPTTEEQGGAGWGPVNRRRRAHRNGRCLLEEQKCENHARKMRSFFTRRLEPKTRSSLPR